MRYVLGEALSMDYMGYVGIRIQGGTFGAMEFRRYQS